MKSERRVRNNFFNSGVNGKIGYFNETIGHVNEAIQSEESERKNKTTM